VASRFNKMSLSSCIATLLPRGLGKEVVYLPVSEFKEIYRAYLQKVRLFMERYYAISLAFCTEIYAGKQYQSFPAEWEDDMALLYGTPTLFLGVIELQDLTLLQLEEMKHAGIGISKSLLEFLQLARDLSLSRVHFNPLSTDQCNSIIKYIKIISQHNALLFNCAQKKALEVFFLSIIIAVLTCRKDLIQRVLEHELSSDSNGIHEAQVYILNKVAFYQGIRDRLTSLGMNHFVQHPSIELDFGAGHGYYSVYNTIEMDKTLIAIEGSLKHAEGLCRYIAGVKPNVTSQSGKNASSSVALNRLRVALLYVDDGTSGARIGAASIPIQDLSDRIRESNSSAHVCGSVIQGARFLSISSSTKPSGPPQSECTGQDQQYSAIGLHACGPLSVIALKMLMQRDVTSAFTIPCCYGHLTKDTFPLSDQGTALVNSFFSATGIKTMFRSYHEGILPREFLTYAASDCVFTWSEVVDTIQSYCARATVELARRQQFPTPAKRALDKDLKGRLCGDDTSLLEVILTDLQRETDLTCSSSPTEGDSIGVDQRRIAQSAIDYAKSHRWVMQAHYLARKVSGHIFETFILMDRLAGLIEQAERSSMRLCAGILPALTEISPRGFLVYGFKC
ncbi:Putative methyltransferase domain containing protein, partial [Giardia duodenalis]